MSRVKTTESVKEKLLKGYVPDTINASQREAVQYAREQLNRSGAAFGHSVEWEQRKREKDGRQWVGQ